jgi:hypothetical protein
MIQCYGCRKKFGVPPNATKIVGCTFCNLLLATHPRAGDLSAGEGELCVVLHRKAVLLVTVLRRAAVPVLYRCATPRVCGAAAAAACGCPARPVAVRSRRAAVPAPRGPSRAGGGVKQKKHVMR